MVIGEKMKTKINKRLPKGLVIYYKIVGVVLLICLFIEILFLKEIFNDYGVETTIFMLVGTIVYIFLCILWVVVDKKDKRREQIK